MHELSVFERRLAAGLDAYSGPRRDVDAVAIARTAASRPAVRRSVLSRFSQLIARGAVVPGRRLGVLEEGRAARPRAMLLAAALIIVLALGAVVVGSGLLGLPPVVPPTSSPSATHVFSPTPDAPARAAWTTTGSMATPRRLHTATLLSNGMVLVAGGGTPASAAASAELFDPASGSWRATAPMSVPRSAQTATLLANGTVLVAGGYSDFHALSSAELYDPITGKWTATGSMVEARGYHTATLLPDGSVLVTGGRSNDSSTGRALASAELYDPATGRWTTTGSMQRARAFHSATLLETGQVLVAGAGLAGVRVDIGVTAELYDPATGTWAETGNMSSARANHTATLLPSGLVLVAGGFDSVAGSTDGLGVGAALASSELYDPATGGWRAADDMIQPHPLSAASLLGDGEVLVVGGASVETGGASFGGGTSASSSDPGLTTAELFDTASELWRSTASLSIPRELPAVVLLNDGRLLVVGGSSVDFGWSSAELYAVGTP